LRSKARPDRSACSTAGSSTWKKVVWRIRVLDSAGKPLDGSGLKSVVVELLGG
jgi:hypothetical protein